MTDREKLIELIRKSGCVQTWDYHTDDFADPNPNLALADHLLANGVIVMPIKVDDTFYGVNETSYDAYCVYGFKWGKRRGDDEDVLIVLTTYDMEFVWGEEAFATKEEAEQALKGGEG